MIIITSSLRYHIICHAHDLQSLVSCKEEAKPGAGGRGGVLASQEEPNQHPNDFIIGQGLTIPGRKGREEGEGGVVAVNVPTTVCSMSALTCM